MATRDSKTKKAETIRELWMKSNSAGREKWRTVNQKGYDYYTNDQISETLQDKLDKAGMPDFTVNMMTPQIQLMKYFITANQPRWKAVGAEGSDAEIAGIHMDMMDYSWHLSGGKGVYAQVSDDILAKSKGYFHNFIDPNADEGMGEVLVESVNPWNVWIDPQARRVDEEDAAYKLIKIDFPKHQLKQMLPAYAKIIETASGQEDGEAYSQRNFDRTQSVQQEDIAEVVEPTTAENVEKLPYYLCYRKIRVPLMNVFTRQEPTEDEMQEIKAQVDMRTKEMLREMDITLQEKQLEFEGLIKEDKMIPERAQFELQKIEAQMKKDITEQQQVMVSKLRDEFSQIEKNIITVKEFQALMQNDEVAKTVVDFKKFHAPRIQMSVTVGNKYLYEKILQTEYYPLIGIPFFHTGTPYPISAATLLTGKQDEINRAHQIMIHNANLSSNLRWLVMEGTINRKQWEEYSSSSGAILTWNSLTGDGRDAPKEIMPLPLNNAFYQITIQARDDMEYMSGIQSSMMGITQAQPEPYRGILANDEFGTRRIKMWIQNTLEPGLELVGKSFLDLAQSLYSEHKVFRIVQPNPENPDELAEIEHELNVPIYDDVGEEIGKYRDYQSARMDIRIISGSMLPINRWAVLDEYWKYYVESQGRVVDDIAFLQMTDIKNKSDIIKRNSALAQANSQLKQMTEEIKNLKGLNQSLQRELVHAGIAYETKVMENELGKSATDMKGAHKLAREGSRQELSVFKKNLELQQKEEALNMREKQLNDREKAIKGSKKS